MDEFWPQPPSGPLQEREAMEHLDPLLERRFEQRPWEVRAAQWRAWALAEIAFGEGVQVAWAGRAGYQGVRALLTLNVPFRNLPDHQARESLFLAWAQTDEILSGMPLIFVFQPEPVSV
jgi:hypothetical protein